MTTKVCVHHAKGFERLSSHGTLRHNVRARFYASVQSLLLFSSTLYIAPPCQCSLYPSLILAVITLHNFCVTRSIDFFSFCETRSQCIAHQFPGFWEFTTCKLLLSWLYWSELLARGTPGLYPHSAYHKLTWLRDSNIPNEIHNLAPFFWARKLKSLRYFQHLYRVQDLECTLSRNKNSWALI